jgi:catechol 2,3-dioxygenase-like lactoylglutathione lyase family enzyme
VRSRLHHVSIFVSNLERSLTLFKDHLGFELAWRLPQLKGKKLSELLGIPGMEADVTYLTSPTNGVAIELTCLQKPRMEYQSVHFGMLGSVGLSLFVEEIEDLYGRLSRKGWLPLSPIMDLQSPDGIPIRAFCIKTDEGVVIELIGPSASSH